MNIFLFIHWKEHKIYACTEWNTPGVRYREWPRRWLSLNISLVFSGGFSIYLYTVYARKIVGYTIEFYIRELRHRLCRAYLYICISRSMYNLCIPAANVVQKVQRGLIFIISASVLRDGMGFVEYVPHDINMLIPWTRRANVHRAAHKFYIKVDKMPYSMDAQWKHAPIYMKRTEKKGFLVERSFFFLRMFVLSQLLCFDSDKG